MNRVCLVTAMASESAPCLAHFRLRRCSDAGNIPGVLYESEHVLLLQTGVGKLKAATSVAALLAARPGVNAVINTGICGADCAIGTRWFANAIHDVSTGKRWYPHLPPTRLLPTVGHQALHCVDRPSTDYQNDTLFDMESAGVMEAASAFLDLSSVQCLKIVSDSPARPMEHLSKSEVPDLVTEALPALEALIHYLGTRGDTQIPGLAEQHRVLLQGRHSTVTQAYALRRLLERHVALTGKLPDIERFSAETRIRDINRRLSDELEGLPLRY